MFATTCDNHPLGFDGHTWNKSDATFYVQFGRASFLLAYFAIYLYAASHFEILIHVLML